MREGDLETYMAWSAVCMKSVGRWAGVRVPVWAWPLGRSGTCRDKDGTFLLKTVLLQPLPGGLRKG